MTYDTRIISQIDYCNSFLAGIYDIAAESSTHLPGSTHNDDNATTPMCHA